MHFLAVFVSKPASMSVFLSVIQPSDRVLESTTTRLVPSPLAQDCSTSVLNCINTMHLNTEFVLEWSQRMQRVLISPTGNRKQSSNGISGLGLTLAPIFHLSSVFYFCCILYGYSYQPVRLQKTHFRIFSMRQDKFSYVDKRKDYVGRFGTQCLNFTQLERNRPKPQKQLLVFMQSANIFPKTDTWAQLPHRTQHDVCINLLKSSDTHTHFFRSTVFSTTSQDSGIKPHLNTHQNFFKFFSASICLSL